MLLLIATQLSSQEIKDYNLNLKIDATARKLYVEGLIKVDFKNKRDISLILWKNSIIKTININDRPCEFSFDTVSPSPIMYIQNGRKLTVNTNISSERDQSLYIKYESDMRGLSGWASSFSDDWIELNFYTAWFPVNTESYSYTSKINLVIDKGYHVSSSGIVTDNKQYIELSQPLQGFDMVIIASKNLKTKSLNANNVHIEVVYSELSELEADSIITECKYAFELYQKLFEKRDSSYFKFVIAPFDGGGYSRKNFVSMRSKKFNLHTRTGIGHELAHFWCTGANTSTWEDWLNESFAEYSMLLYLRETLGQDVFNKQIEAYKKDVINTPPIWGIDRNSNAAYYVLYEKGALYLYELEQKIGQEEFVKLLKTTLLQRIRTTDGFLKLIEKQISKETSAWTENYLKTK